MAFPSDSPLPTPDYQRGELAVVKHRRVSASITPVDLRVHEAAAAAAEAGDESDDDFHDLQQGTGTPRETASSSEPHQDLLAPADPAQAAQAKPLDSSRLGLGNGGVAAEALRAEPSSFARPKEQPKQQQQQQPIGGPDNKRKEPKEGWADEMDKQEEGVTAVAKSNGARHGEKKEKGRGRKARMAANKRAAASSKVVVPGAEPSEEPPMPCGAAADAQHAQQAARAPGRTPAFAAADTPADESDKEERFSEAQDFQDGGSSINHGKSDYMQSGYMRSEASQDTPVSPSDGHNREPSYFQEPPRSPMAPKPAVLSEAVEEAYKKREQERLEETKKTWGDCRQLFIGNLGPHTSEDALKWAFRNYNIVHVKLVREYVTDPRMAGTGRAKGYGFLTFDTPENAFRALTEMQRTCPLERNRPIRLERLNDGSEPQANRAHLRAVAVATAEPTAHVNSPTAARHGFSSYKPSAKELFMGNIGGSVTDVQVHAAFVDYNLMHVRLPRHPGTGNVRRFGFLTFATEEDGLRALEEMDGSYALNPAHPIKLTINTEPSAKRIEPEDMIDLDLKRLYMGNLHDDVTEEAIWDVFRDYNLEGVRLVYDRETGCFRGFGFLTFSSAQDAQRALHEMNQQPLPGTQWAIKLGVDKDYVPPRMMRASIPTPTNQADRSESPGRRTQGAVSRLEDSYTLVSDKRSVIDDLSEAKGMASSSSSQHSSLKNQAMKGPVKKLAGMKDLSAGDSNPYACLADVH
ncbi:hypothetical protein WJX75_007280 [Coccomyxa subellipsoidea]|uniref:RRM domain-containing protein n=1 Tax=Coccomyxa subellipsoidea TaxID=248742 RepID=A0ABR2Z4U6_9CHLO